MSNSHLTLMNRDKLTRAREQIKNEMPITRNCGAI